jgi:rare lipoprotein A
MSWSRIITAVAISMLAHWAATGPALAQTFEERWSPIPKAHAEPSAAPRSNSQPDPNEPGVTAPEVIEPPRAEVPKTIAKQSSRGRPAARRVFTGRASYYAYHGGKTASGQPFNPDALTAAHRTLPFGTRVRVTDIKTNKSVVVVITDRGPAARNRVLDLSAGAARALNIGGRGIIQVRAQVIGG